LNKESTFKRNILQFIDYKGISKYDFYKKTSITRGVLDSDSGLSEDNATKFLVYFTEINPIWFLTGKGEMLLTNNNQQQPTAATGDLEKDLVTKFANISPRDIAFYSHLKLDIMMQEPVFKALIENLATKRALELLKEK